LISASNFEREGAVRVQDSIGRRDVANDRWARLFVGRLYEAQRRPCLAGNRREHTHTTLVLGNTNKHGMKSGTVQVVVVATNLDVNANDRHLF